MQRRTFLCCRPCLLNLRRHASRLQSRPTAALASALLSHNLQQESNKKKKNRAVAKTIDVVNPTTAETFTLSLNRIKPFTEEYALLPLQQRQYVERRHLLSTLRSRTKQEYTVPIDKDDKLYKPEESLVEKFIKEEYEIRGLKEDDPITFSQQRSIEEIATERAKEVEEEELNRRKLAALAHPLTFEEQWRRRDSYGENILNPMKPKMVSRYSPTRDLKNPIKPRNVAVEHLLAAGCHIGHNKSAVHFAMKPFISGLHGTTHIINLDYTIAHLRRACFLIREVSFRQGIILFLGTRKGHKPIVVEAAERMDGYCLNNRWIAGTITNGSNVLHRGKAIELRTPFRHFADEAIRAELKKKEETEPLWEGSTMVRLVWDRRVKKWIRADESLPEFRDWHGELRSPENIRDMEPPPEPVVVKAKAEAGEVELPTTLDGSPPTLVGKQEISSLEHELLSGSNEQEQLKSADANGKVLESESPAPSSEDPIEPLEDHAKPSESQTAPTETDPRSATVDQPSSPAPTSTADSGNTLSSTLDLPSKTIGKKARARGDLEHWMAWDKFASIVQSISDNAIATLIDPAADSLDKSTLPELSLDPISNYIPDHKDFWYKRQLQAENDEHDRRQTIAAQTGDRTPLETYHMDKFMARQGWTGLVRGEKIAERVENWKKDGLSGYEYVKVFRDGTSMIEKQRYTKEGKPMTQFWDGSYLLNGHLYDQEGMRYDYKTNSLSFSDGSELIFEGRGESKKLLVKIGKQTFDVTSTVIGSTEKREILEKASDLFEPARTLSTHDDTAALATALEVPSPDLVKFETEHRVKTEEESRDDEVFHDEDPVLMRGSQMFEFSEKLSARQFDRFVKKSNRMTDVQEDTGLMDRENWTGDEPPIPEELEENTNYMTKRASTFRPDLIVCLNPRENKLAMKEAADNHIPTIGICDTDSDPRQVTYNIPANDDSLRSVEYIAGVLSRAGQEGLIHRQRYAEQMQLLLGRAQDLVSDSWLDYELLTYDPNSEAPKPIPEDGRTKEDILDKYRGFYRVEKAPEEMVVKIVAQQIVLGQNEIKRLTMDTTDWSMQQHLDHIKSSVQFPGIPVGVLEELAQSRLSESRRVWAETREQLAMRPYRYRSPPSEI